MKKSTYSLILSDSVVEAIDRMAYAMKTSRSGLINEILAKHVSYITPEQRMRGILNRAQRVLLSREGYSFQEMQSPSFLDVRAALKYKYKPTIRYCVELYTGNAPFGQIRVSLRTQSEQLLSEMTRFFHMWETMESRYLRPYYPSEIPSAYESNTFARDFYLPHGRENVSEDALGQAIAQYVSVLDSTLKIYLNELDDPAHMQMSAVKNYLNYLEQADLII